MKTTTVRFLFLTFLASLLAVAARGDGWKRMTPVRGNGGRSFVAKTQPNPNSCRICGATMGLHKDVMLCPAHWCAKHEMARPDGTCPQCAFEKDARKGQARCVYCGRRATTVVPAPAEKPARAGASSRAAKGAAADAPYIRVCADHFCRTHGRALQRDKLDEFFCAACQDEAKKERQRAAKRAREERAAEQARRRAAKAAASENP